MKNTSYVPCAKTVIEQKKEAILERVKKMDIAIEAANKQIAGVAASEDEINVFAQECMFSRDQIMAEIKKQMTALEV